MEQTVDQVIEITVKYGMQVLGAIVILVAGRFGAGFVRRLIRRALVRAEVGETIVGFLGQFAYITVLVGSVKDIRLFSTIMATPDNVHMVVPNGKIFNDVIKNYSINETRRVDITVAIGYGDSIDRAMEALLDVLKSDGRIIQEPAPQIVVTELADSSVNLLVRCWTKRVDFRPVKCDLTKSIKENREIQGIEIPFPQRTVHTVSK
jgi:small conductance mechanosensitive channel